MANTPIYALPEWAAAQATPWLTENQAKRLIEAVVRGSVLDRDLSAPPGSCADGACYLVAASPTGAWAGQAGKLAVAVGANAASGWLFASIATAGQLLWVEDEAVRLHHDGAAWSVLGAKVQSVTSAATVTPTFTADQVNITAQAAALTLANPTGTAVDGKRLTIRIKDDGTGRAIAYGTQYRAIGVTLPTTTVAGKTLYLSLVFNAAETKWDVIAVAQEA